jgi:hypothetical protein
MKFEWLKYIKDVLPGLVKSKLMDLATQALVGLTGFQAWIAKVVIKKLVKIFDVQLRQIVNIVFNRVKAGIDERRYQEEINKPDSDAEDIRDAARDIIDGKH